MTYLLDANVLIALTVAEHEHHERASRWLAGAGVEAAVCPTVQGALVRFVLRMGESPTTAAALVRALGDHPRVVFWPDDLSYATVALDGLTGHRQVTDTYLAAVAVAHGGLLATFDAGLLALRPDSTFAVP